MPMGGGFWTQRKPYAVLVGLCALTLVLGGCGGHAAAPPLGSAGSAACPQTPSGHFDKTKFAAHAGLGFGAFHHFIYRPFKSGELSSGTPGRVGRLAKAGLATAFTVHELKVAKRDAEDDPTLCRAVAAPLSQAAASLQRLSGSVRSGNVSGGDLDQVNGTLGQAQQGSAREGDPAPDQVPSSDQLTHPT
ncbi:MAG: hypothetical protein JO272_10540 [Pseudonocardiales bacterium]|nr:hypothetical protein [Pseudonocardiales bacterium]